MSCNKCQEYKRKIDRYKEKYEIAKSGLTEEERNILIKLICNEQIKYIIPNGKHDTYEYKQFEKLKAKIRTI